jgi:hypothetical protein
MVKKPQDHKQKVKLAKVGDRKIFYTEVLIVKDKVRVAGIAEYTNLAAAKKNIREKVRDQFGNAKYKIVQLYRLPAEMEIEEVV